jgi:two-component system chemotaxis response regulator CheB
VIKPGHVYVAPGNHHIELRGQSGFTLTPTPDTAQHTPSIDMFFRSAAARFKDNVVAVVLTGMGNDGQAGVRTVKACGGVVIAQDERTSAIFGMPKMAMETGCVDVVAPLQDIAQWIIHHACRSRE